jgi:SNF2 family DNA or RNA helicase
MQAKAEIFEDSKIKVEFPFHPKAVQVVRDIPGSRFVPREKGGPYWLLPLSMESGRELRQAFSGEGDEINYGKKLLTWGKEERARERNLSDVTLADDAELPNLAALEVKMAKEYRRSNKVLKEQGFKPRYDSQPLHKWMRPDQRVNAAFMARTSCINGDQQGLGKTVEWIAAIYEANMQDGYHLVSAPVTSLDNTWVTEIVKWMDITILTGDTPAKRKQALEVAVEMYESEEPFVLLVNPAMMIMHVEKKGGKPVHTDSKGRAVRSPKHPEFERIAWTTVTVDEFHKMGLGNPDTAQREAHVRVGRKAQRFWPMSGTPMGGKPIKLWGALNAIEPKKFSSKWAFVGHYLQTEEHEYESKGEVKTGKTIGDIRPEKEAELQRMLSTYMVRHLKSEVLKNLPPKQYVDVWCKMHPKQAKQYEQFAKEAELKIETERMSIQSVLDEYTRLKQFASAWQKVEKVGTRENVHGDTLGVWQLTPQADRCGKLPYLVDKLAEQGITKEDPDGDSVAVVGSQFKTIIKMTHEYLNAIGIKSEMITGDTPERERNAIKRRFQDERTADSPRVLLLVTTAAVSLTLDRADTVHILDETWNPDDQEQLEDRIHRGSRIHQVVCFYYRSSDTIEEYINEVTDGKMVINKSLLDDLRNKLKEMRSATA